MVAATISLLGIAVATYVAITEFGGGTPVCIAGGHGCETVAHSRYAHLAGINIAAIGIFGYVLLLAAAGLGGDPGRTVGLVLALVGFGYSAYLTYLELFTINAICQWCVASAVLMTVMLAVCSTRFFRYAGESTAGTATR